MVSLVASVLAGGQLGTQPITSTVTEQPRGRLPRRLFRRPSWEARTAKQSERLIAAAQAKRERKVKTRWYQECQRRNGYYFIKNTTREGRSGQ